MSGDVRRPAEEVRPVVEAFLDMLRPHAEWIEIGGSLRRCKPMVGDAEIVVMPKPSYNAELDRLVESGVIEKALYGQKLVRRWGAKARGLLYGGVKIESYACDEDNRGFQFWLRTGPDSSTDRANTFVVTTIKQRAPFRLHDGYVWVNEQKLRISTEQDWFDLLGIPFVDPADRSVRTYARMFAARLKWGDPAQFLMRQQALQITAAPKLKEVSKPGIKRKAASAPTLSSVWERPWMQDDGRVLLHAGYGEWAFYDPDDEYARQYLDHLRRDVEFRATDERRLRMHLEIVESERRWERIENAATQLVSMLKGA